MRKLLMLALVGGMLVGPASAVSGWGKTFQATPLYGENGRILKWDCDGTCLPGACCELSAE